jgi:hypothetical protein
MCHTMSKTSHVCGLAILLPRRMQGPRQRPSAKASRTVCPPVSVSLPLSQSTLPSSHSMSLWPSCLKTGSQVHLSGPGVLASTGALVEWSTAHHSQTMESTTLTAAGRVCVCSSTGVHMFIFARCQGMCDNRSRTMHQELETLALCRVLFERLPSPCVAARV